ncbi:MAG TPA: bifunctional 3-(3-hydroxy-phenyl)propionate/3-hydroxycinnamic acid hydroxylase [Microthrixaceae bacterium]|nr:bifunctional 3-(3-hydroxy-phenyl)propionate/3-hydroxycinnamic acid hydroxylase [Microthrixaceae bacterium]
MSDPVVGDAAAEVDADVAIVGAGPSGLVLAVLLAQLGRSVIVLEQWPERYSLPRAVHFDDEVGRLLQSCGIGDEVRALSEPAEVYEWRNAAGTTLLRFGRIGTGPSGWPFSSMFCQPDLEAALEARANALPTVATRRGITVDVVEQDESHVTLGCTGGTTVTARYVVGCDGANSTVRRVLDIGVEDRGFFYDWLIVDVILDEPRVFDPINLQVCDPQRPTSAVSGGPGRRRWEFMRLPEESLDELGQAATAWALLEPWDVHPGNARIERHAVYTFQARVADRWQDGRVFLAGDAAHLMPPFAGQGMCSGIRDVANLAWKLDLVLAGVAGPDVLVTYEEERKPGAEFAIDLSIELGKVICVPDAQEAAERDEAMASAVTGEVSEVPGQPGLGSGLIHPDAPLAGEQFPQPDLSGRRFDDVHGAGWRLVTDDPAGDDLDPGLVDWLGTIGGAVIQVADTAPALAAWFRRHEVRWAFQRPDFHLYGAAADVDGAADLVGALREQLTS